MKMFALFVFAGCAFAQRPCDGLVLEQGIFPYYLTSPDSPIGSLNDVACKDGDAIVEGFGFQALSVAQPLTNFVLKIVSPVPHLLQFVVTFDGQVVGPTPDSFLIQYTVGDPAHPQWVGVKADCPANGPPIACGAAAPFITLRVCGWIIQTSSCLGGDVWPGGETSSGGSIAVSTQGASAITVLTYPNFWTGGTFTEEFGYTPLLPLAKPKVIGGSQD
jgi:hypothetical protein